MTTLNGTILFWFLAQGLTIGLIYGVVIKKEGVSLNANGIWGMIGSAATGTIAIVFGLGDGLLFAFVGTLAVLFIVNAFHFHHKEDISGQVDRGIKISEQ